MMNLYLKVAFLRRAKWWLIALLFLIVPIEGRADVAKEANPSVFSQKEAVSNQFLSFNLFGLTYTYEHAFTPKATVLFSGGASYTLGDTWSREIYAGYSNTRFYHLLSAYLAVEPRYYYNLEKRSRMEKQTAGNSGGYLSVEALYGFPLAVSRNIDTSHILSVTPYWGFRRVWNHFLLDVSGGLGLLATSDGDAYLNLAFRLGLGYKF